MTYHQIAYVRISAKEKLKRLVCAWLGRHGCYFRIYEPFPGGIKPHKHYRCLCGYHQRAAYGAQFDTAVES